jgi:ribonuclease P/MRP protein subunit POP5
MVRFKYRYLVFQVEYENAKAVNPSVTAEVMEGRFRSNLEILFGPYGLGLMQSNISVKYYSGFTGIGIARVGREFYRTLWGALTLLTKMENHTCRINVIHCSGMLSI